MWASLIIAWRAIRFYLDCIHWAAAGTIGRANATYGIIGTLIIYLAGRHWGLGTLKIPDDALSNLFFIFLALIVTWVAIFIIRLFFAPGRLHGDALDKIIVLSELTVPKIKVSLITSNSGVQVVKTRLNGDPATPGPLSKWLQISVESVTNAALEDCAAYVTKIQRLEPDGSIKDLLFESVFCNWSQADSAEMKRIKIPALVPQAANIFSINDNQPRPQLLLEFNHRKFQLEDEMQIPGKYKIEIVVSANGTGSVKKHFLLDWDGTFAKIDLTPFDS